MSISLKLDSDTEQRLKELVRQTGKSLDVLLQELVQHGLEDLEDLHMADATMQRVVAGEEPIYSSVQVRKNLGLAD